MKTYHTKNQSIWRRQSDRGACHLWPRGSKKSRQNGKMKNENGTKNEKWKYYFIIIPIVNNIFMSLLLRGPLFEKSDQLYVLKMLIVWIQALVQLRSGFRKNDFANIREADIADKQPFAPGGRVLRSLLSSSSLLLCAPKAWEFLQHCPM